MLQLIDLVSLFIPIPIERSSVYPVKNAHELPLETLAPLDQQRH
jgi:hypothetical protein